MVVVHIRDIKTWNTWDGKEQEVMYVMMALKSPAILTTVRGNVLKYLAEKFWSSFSFKTFSIFDDV